LKVDCPAAITELSWLTDMRVQIKWEKLCTEGYQKTSSLTTLYRCSYMPLKTQVYCVT
jgi:hypothetical protein